MLSRHEDAHFFISDAGSKSELEDRPVKKLAIMINK